MPGRKLGPWSDFPFLYRFTVLLNSGGSSSPWSEFWSEFPHVMGMEVVPAPSTILVEKFNLDQHFQPSASFRGAPRILVKQIPVWQIGVLTTE